MKATKAPNQQQSMKFTYKINDKRNGTIFTFENGVILETFAAGGNGYVTYPPKDECGPFGFPVRHAGDAFHALRMGRPIPAHCRAW